MDIKEFSQESLNKLFKPEKESHKGQNGKLTIIGGSELFHGASLWALQVASRIVDMVFYSSTEENNELTKKMKGELYDFIAVPREKINEYLDESDVILIGPGMPREEGRQSTEEPTKNITERLMELHANKKWVIDAGALQTLDPKKLLYLHGNVIITPHPREFAMLFGIEATEKSAIEMAKKFNCIILLKGEIDLIVSPDKAVHVHGGNEGMTKGGTGDVLAGLVAALATKSDLFLAAEAGSFFNKTAGDELYKTVGPYFNATDLSNKIPEVMNRYLGD